MISSYDHETILHRSVIKIRNNLRVSSDQSKESRSEEMELEGATG